MSGTEEPVSGREALAAELGQLLGELGQQRKTQKAAVEEANRRRGQEHSRALSLQTVNGWFPKQRGSKEPSVPADFEDLWSVVGVMLEWTKRPIEHHAMGEHRRHWKRLHEAARRPSVLDEQVRAYLEAACKAAEQHPYPGFPGPADPPSLEEVYVRQRSRPAVRDSHDVAHRAAPAVAGSDTTIATAIEPAEVVFQTAEHVCVLIAGPGVGKSTLLRSRLREAAECLAGNAGKTPTAVPVWVSARSLAGEETQVPDALAAATRKLSRYGRHPELGKARFLQRPCTGAHWQLLVDGLDELPNAQQRRAVLEKLASAIAGDPPLYRCVVATRPLAESELDVLDRVLGHKAPRYDLQPFTADDLRTYTGKYFGTRWPQDETARRARQFTAALRSAALAELAHTPLMAFMLCQLYLADPERPLPEGRTAVYKAFTNLLYENNQSRHIADSHEETIARLVESFQTVRARREADQAARQVHEQLPELIDYLAHQWRRTRHRGPAVATLSSHKAVHRPNKVHPGRWDAFLRTCCGTPAC
ncbi:NACHT domain-containing protein [Actinocatenispora sera]|uniref:NACHT domain-containing protein n=1 Tax=Actinocatenispora sera TaxID=390989 RepID=UPI0033E6F2F7